MHVTGYADNESAAQQWCGARSSTTARAHIAENSVGLSGNTGARPCSFLGRSPRCASNSIPSSAEATPSRSSRNSPAYTSRVIAADA